MKNNKQLHEENEFSFYFVVVYIQLLRKCMRVEVKD